MKKYIYFFCFDILIFFCFFYVQKFVKGLTVRDNDQIYEVRIFFFFKF